MEAKRSNHGFPLLLLSCRPTTTNNRRNRSLYSPLEPKLHPIGLPDRSRPERCLGSSSDGWLCMADDSLQLYLLNPFSNSVVILPPLRTTLLPMPRPHPRHRRSLTFSVIRRNNEGIELIGSGAYVRDEYLQKAVWSAKPTDPNCVIVLLWQTPHSIVCCRRGDEQWTVIRTSLSFVSDAIFYREKLYVVGCEKTMRVVAIDLLHQEEQEMVMPEFGFHIDLGDQMYLAEGPSGLLFTVRHLLHWVHDVAYVTLGFETFRFDETVKKWVKTDSLGDGMLFLGQNTSMWVSCSDFKKCRGNCIYFTDDYMDDSTSNLASVGMGEDSGVFHLDDESFGSIYDDEDMKWKYPYPVWVVLDP
ncbi:hypothetical protein QJS04_geneDACA021430 [Acorus gramineus]|uniref:KIB1-4 beta-propeller domain-containing protein n=1 Tax=Acorus gramineus TaxID=55184 RepID=A0AAV9A4P0_ACOGR|nr:hypothetical protein QJS04_geneDACA021430 [Acorus gramineus]